LVTASVSFKVLLNGVTDSDNSGTGRVLKLNVSGEPLGGKIL
jgi:hypothetical protein